MAVGIISGRQVSQDRQEDPLDKIAKGLNIAQSVFGIATNIDTLSKNKQLRDYAEKEALAKEALVPSQLESAKLEEAIKRQKQLEGEQEQQGILTTKQAASLGTLHSNLVPGSYPVKLASEPDKVQYLLPRSEAQLQAAKITANAALDEKRIKREEEIAQRQIEGFELPQGKVPSAKAIEDLRDKAVSARNLITTTNELEQLYKENGAQAVGPVKAKMDQKVQDIIIQMKNIGGLGQISASDLNILLKQVPDVTGFEAVLKKKLGLSNDASISAVFDGLKRGALSKVDNVAKTSGYKRVDNFGVANPQPGPQDINQIYLEEIQKLKKGE